MPNITAIEVRDAVLPRDGEAVRRLWLDYLVWVTMRCGRATESIRIHTERPWNRAWHHSPSSVRPLTRACSGPAARPRSDPRVAARPPAAEAQR
jgi:hypothetical protein